MAFHTFDMCVLCNQSKIIKSCARHEQRARDMKIDLRLLGLFVALMNPLFENSAFAQFYDTSNEIHYYVNVEDPRYCIVLNFDGMYATFFNHSYQYSTSFVSDKLNSNPNYFVNITSTSNYRLKFISGFSGTAYCLRETRNSLYGSYTDSYVFEFSQDREILYYKCYPQTYNPSSLRNPTKQETYKRVPKDYFITEKVGRTDSKYNNGLIEENKKSPTCHKSTSIGFVDNSNIYGNTNSNYSTDDTARQKTKVRKKCAYCSGKGERIQHEYVSKFGLDGPRVYCNICKQSWSYGTVHAHHKCNHCNGTGYYEYDY